MRKVLHSRIILILIALAIVTISLFSVLLHRAAAFSQDCCATVEPIKKGELFWESLSHYFVSFVVR